MNSNESYQLEKAIDLCLNQLGNQYSRLSSQEKEMYPYLKVVLDSLQIASQELFKQRVSCL